MIPPKDQSQNLFDYYEDKLLDYFDDAPIKLINDLIEHLSVEIINVLKYLDEDSDIMFPKEIAYWEEIQKESKKIK